MRVDECGILVERVLVRYERGEVEEIIDGRRLSSRRAVQRQTDGRAQTSQVAKNVRTAAQNTDEERKEEGRKEREGSEPEGERGRTGGRRGTVPLRCRLRLLSPSVWQCDIGDCSSGGGQKSDMGGGGIRRGTAAAAVACCGELIEVGCCEDGDGRRRRIVANRRHHCKRMEECVMTLQCDEESVRTRRQHGGMAAAGAEAEKRSRRNFQRVSSASFPSSVRVKTRKE